MASQAANTAVQNSLLGRKFYSAAAWILFVVSYPSDPHRGDITQDGVDAEVATDRTETPVDLASGDFAVWDCIGGDADRCPGWVCCNGGLIPIATERKDVLGVKRASLTGLAMAVLLNGVESCGVVAHFGIRCVAGATLDSSSTSPGQPAIARYVAAGVVVSASEPVPFLPEPAVSMQ